MAKKATKTTKRTKRRKAVPIQFIIRKFSDYSQIQENDKNKAFIYLNLIKSVTVSISHKDVTSIELFDLVDHNVTLGLKREDWKDALGKAIEFFSEREYYEKAAECRNLIALL